MIKAHDLFKKYLNFDNAQLKMLDMTKEITSDEIDTLISLYYHYFVSEYQLVSTNENDEDERHVTLLKILIYFVSYL